ncbi:hypothetical protein YC2023_046411 [Brassica napus]
MVLVTTPEKKRILRKKNRFEARVFRRRPPFLFPAPSATELAGVAAGLSPTLHLLRRLFGFMSSFYFIVLVNFGLLATTATPTPPISAISLAPLFLGAAPLSSSDSAAFHCCSDSDSSTTAVNLRRSGRGGGSLSCKIDSSTVRSRDPPTTSGYNHHLSPNFVNNLAGLDNVGNVPIEATPTHQGLYGDKIYRVDLLPSPTTARSCVDVRLVPPPVTHRRSSISSCPLSQPDLSPTPPLKISKSILSPPTLVETSTPMSTLPHLITDPNARPHNPHRKDVDALLQSFDLIKYFWFSYGNAKVQRLGSVKTSALSSLLIIFSVSVKVNSTSKSKLSIVDVRCHFQRANNCHDEPHLFGYDILCSSG